MIEMVDSIQTLTAIIKYLVIVMYVLLLVLIYPMITMKLPCKAWFLWLEIIIIYTILQAFTLFILYKTPYF